MESTSPALSVSIAVLTALLGLTGFGIYTAFGPPSRQLDDPFDDHDDRAIVQGQRLMCQGPEAAGHWLRQGLKFWVCHCKLSSLAGSNPSHC